MADMMEFPATVDEFMEKYKMVDTEQYYSNGAEYVPIFRMRQWFEHEAADVRPVVLCRDCKHSYEDISGRCCAYGVCVDWLVDDDFFCAYGVQEFSRPEPSEEENE